MVMNIIEKMIERKCKECNTWNGENDYCFNCNSALSPKARNKKELEEAGPPEKDLPEQILEKASESRFLIVKLFFYSIYGFMMVFISIGAFLAWLTAMIAA